MTEATVQQDYGRYNFRTDQIAYEIIETKAGKDYIIKGYISTNEIDLYNDLVTPNGLQSMLKQINERNITLDYEHEAWRDDSSILPVGRIVEASIDDRGLWVKALLNPASPKFKDLWESIKGQFVDAFSIAFTPIKTAMKIIDDVEVRLIDDLNLLNVALTGNPVCPGARMTGYDMKSIMLKSLNDFKVKEEKTMAELKAEAAPKAVEVKDEAPKAEAPVEAKEEVAEAVEEVKEEEPKEEAKEASEPVVEEKSENKELFADLKSEVDTLKKELADLKAQPVFKSPAEKTQLKAEQKEEAKLNIGLDLIR